MFEPFKFKPDHQPDPEKPVEFELKPLDMATFYRLQNAIARNADPSWDEMMHIVQNFVVGWSGMPQAYSAQAKRAIATAEGNSDLYIWLGQVAGKLYDHALLKGSERKNS